MDGCESYFVKRLSLQRILLPKTIRENGVVALRAEDSRRESSGLGTMDERHAKNTSLLYDQLGPSNSEPLMRHWFEHNGERADAARFPDALDRPEPDLARAAIRQAWTSASLL